jgi:4-amino-4-deoxy-L-arabinose transferase-like glycosyltransferase
MNRSRRWIALFVFTGLALRLAFAVVYWTGRPLTHDEREYLALARSLARGEGFVYPADEPPPGTSQRFGRAPGYPAFLSLLRVTWPVEALPTRVKVTQACVSAIGIWLIALIAAHAAGPPAGVAAAGLAAIYPPLVWMPSYALSETLFSTVALAAALTLGAYKRRIDTPRPATKKEVDDLSRRVGAMPIAIAAGLLTGVAILIRPVMLMFVPLAIVWLLWISRRLGAARTLRCTAAFTLATVLCVAPWAIRNALVYGRFVAVASEGGVTFWTGNHPLALGEGDLAANPELKRAELEFRSAHPGLTAEELEPLYYRDAFTWIRDHRTAWLQLEARKLLYTVVPVGPSLTLHSAKYFIGSAAAYLLVLPGAVIGAWLLWRSGRAPMPLWLMGAATVIAGLVFFPQERFRIPVIDPALIVSAAALTGLRADERTRRRPDL